MNAKIFLIILIASNISFSQFDSVIFKKEIFLDQDRPNIFGLGDINDDGYDDFLINECMEKNIYIFYGGNPVDTIPALIISVYFGFAHSLDLNNDRINDLLIITRDDYPDRKMMIFYGGKQIDTIPDLIFNPPPGTKNNFGYGGVVMPDFDGDGRSELVIYDGDLRYSKKQFGCHYFYNTGAVFDTIPEYVLCGDSVKLIRYFLNRVGDLNGDGLTDFEHIVYLGSDNIHPSTDQIRRFYLGNTDWDLTHDAEFYRDEHLFDVINMALTYDLNNDGKGEIIIHDYGFYPYYYLNAILYGGFPIDTIPDIGLNTQNQGISTDVVKLGDVNGDGFNDFMSMAYNFGYSNIKLWVGGRRIHDVADKTWYGTSSGFGRTFGAVGDVNGDGTDDIAIGEITYQGLNVCEPPGRFYIFNGDTSVHADTVNAIEEEKNVPSDYKISEPFPNPFNSSTTVKYEFKNRMFVQIKIYDSLGKEKALLLSEEVNPGNYEIIVDADKYNLASGVYFVTFNISGEDKTTIKLSRKITFLK